VRPTKSNAGLNVDKGRPVSMRMLESRPLYKKTLPGASIDKPCSYNSFSVAQNWSRRKLGHYAQQDGQDYAGQNSASTDDDSFSHELKDVDRSLLNCHGQAEPSGVKWNTESVALMEKELKYLRKRLSVARKSERVPL